MVTPNPEKSAWWIKDTYNREEIDRLIGWGTKHLWTQNHQMADLVAQDGYNIMARGDGWRYLQKVCKQSGGVRSL